MLHFSDHIPLQKIELSPLIGNKVKIFVLRLDTIDHYAGGNKFFKLKYNLDEAKKQVAKTILTFGGAWSNHLAALAASLDANEPKIIAVVRGEEPKELSETLRFCKEKGMHLHFVSREDYRRKREPEFILELKNKFGDFYLLPEGGSNELAVKGCKEIVDFINVDFDFICCPVGSGGTFAGIVSALKEHQKALGFVALKKAHYLDGVISELITPPSPFGATSPLKGEKLVSELRAVSLPRGDVPKEQRGHLLHDYHFGGFAKTTPELLSFKKDFEKQYGFDLDYVYTSKMFYGIFDLIQKNNFPEGSTIIVIHTGGLQGNKGFEKQ